MELYEASQCAYVELAEAGWLLVIIIGKCVSVRHAWSAPLHFSTVQSGRRLHGYAQCVLCAICCRRVATTPYCPPRPITVIHPTDHTDHTDHTDQSQLNMSTQLCCAVTAKHNKTSTKLNCLCCYIISQSCCCIMCQPGKFLISVLLYSPRTVSVLFIHHERQHTTI